MSFWIEPLDKGRDCRRWRIYAQIGSRGTKRRDSDRFTGTKKEALRAAEKLAEELEQAAEPDTFGNFSRSWNEARYASGSISVNTYQQYRFLLNGLSRHIGRIRLDKMTASDVETALTALRNGDTPSGKPWSGTTLRAAYKAANKVFGIAIDRNVARRNPLATVDRPRNDTERRKALDITQSAILLKMLDVREPHQFACSLMLRTGMRPGECLSVTWADVVNDSIVIRRSVTKTDAGERVIPLNGSCVAAIERRKNQLWREPSGSDKLCCNDDLTPLTYNAVKHWWMRNRHRYGMEGWTLHELRHSFATNLAQAGVHPSTMAALLGHSSSEITMEIYTHVHNEDMRKAVEKLSFAANVPANVPAKWKVIPGNRITGQRKTPADLHNFWSGGQDLNLRPLDPQDT